MSDEINEDVKEFDIYGEAYHPILNPKRPEDLIYDKDGKLKDGQGDTIDYEKMLKAGESAGAKIEGPDLNSDYPEMVKEEERRNSGVDYPSEDMKSLPDKRDPVESLASEEDKKQMDKEYPEMVKAGIPDLQ